MKTIKYKEVDGYFIYDGFDVLPSDPKMTIEKADQLFLETDICKKMQKKAAEKDGHWREHFKAMGAAKRLKVESDKSFEVNDSANFKKFKTDQQKAEKEANDRAGAANTCNAELLEMRKEADQLRMQLRRDNIVYAPGPRKNEVLGEPADVEAVIMADMQKGENEVIALDLAMINEIIIEADDPAGTGQRQEYRQYKLNSGNVETVPDFRGKWYVNYETGWQEYIIESIGNTPENDAISVKDLTPEQLEEIRIQNLTEDQRTNEYDLKYDELVNQAAILKNKLEITMTAVTTPVEDAQAWLASHVAALKSLYGVS